MSKIVSLNGVPVLFPLARNRPVVFSTISLAALLSAPSGTTVDLGGDAPSKAALVNFRFNDTVEDGGGALAEFDPYEAVHMEPFRGRLLLLDGMTRNRDYDGDIAVDLEIAAPASAPTSSLSSGSLTGDYSWKYRYKNSTTGKVSGFSPTDSQTLSSQQNSVGITASSDPQVDRIQIFRNINGFKQIFYLVKEVANATGNTPDNEADSTIKDNEMDDVVQGRSYIEGRMHPHTKAKEVFGFVWYYGLLRMGKASGGSVTGTSGNNYVTLTGPKVSWARLMQRLTINGDTVEYRIIDVDESNNRYYVYPNLETSPSSDSYEIIDDRDGRVISISEAGRPGSVPVGHDFTLGADVQDVIHHIFELGDQLFAITERRIFRLDGFRSTEPWFTLAATPVLEEGCVGPRAAIVVPGVGLVYLNSLLGPRVFNGVSSSYLSRDPNTFILQGEWERVREARKREIPLFYDQEGGYIIFSYSRDSEIAMAREMVYDVRTKEWTGPWTRRVFSYGELSDVDHERRIILGSDVGHIVQDHRGELDGGEEGTLSGTLTGVSGRVFTDSNASFKTGTEGLFGRPVEFKDSQGNTSYGVIVSNTATALTLYLLPVPYPQTGWTYRIGVIPWVVQTGYAVTPLIGRNMHINTFEVSLDRGRSGSIRGAIGREGADLYEMSSGEVDLTGRVFGRFKVRKGGTVFQVAVWGSDRGESVKITGAELQVDLRGGEAQ